MMNEVCCMGVTANPRFDVQKCCVVACKRNHFYFFIRVNLYKIIVNVDALCETMVLYVGCSKEPSH